MALVYHQLREQNLELGMPAESQPPQAAEQKPAQEPEWAASAQPQEPNPRQEANQALQDYRKPAEPEGLESESEPVGTSEQAHRHRNRASRRR